MSQLGVILQESLRAEREARTILGLLTHQMDGGGVDREEEEGPRRRRSLKDRLRFTGMGCCGATWVFRPPTLTVRHAQEQEEGAGGPPPPQQQLLQETNPGQAPNPSGPDCVGPSPAGSGMNLAAALAAERQFRGSQEPEPDSGGEGSRGENLGGGGSSTVPETPLRVSLMRLLEETEEKEKGGGAVGNDSVCCVCMGRKKGAAFIPCGHTFCRVCSRELWLNRGTCPLCNCSILEILDIF